MGRLERVWKCAPGDGSALFGFGFGFGCVGDVSRFLT
jgi:hypothetical protein